MNLPVRWCVQFVCATILLVAVRLPARSQQTEQQFIDATTSAIVTFQNSLPKPSHKIVLSANLVYANGAVVTNPALDLSVLLQYVDGLKAAGAQRIDLNPGVTSIDDPAATAVYDALVAHIRELGLQLALNPQVVDGELESGASFQDFQDTAMKTYPALATRYQPDNFVVVHEPTTMAARLGVSATTQQWDDFIRVVAPLIRTASPHTRLGAGGFYDSAEDERFRDFVTIPILDFMTIDLYSYANIAALNAWVQLAQAAVDATHPSGKGIYIEETWAPKFLPNPLPPGWQSNPGGTDALALVGPCSADFAAMDNTWLQAMATWASASGMEAITPFTTEAFFNFGPAGHDKPFDLTYLSNTLLAIQNGQLTSTGQAYLGVKSQFGIAEIASLSSASYATLPSAFVPNCGSAAEPCNARAVVAADDLVSAFGTDLATAAKLDGTFPTSLGGTSATLVDSSNTSYPVPLFFVSAGQVNYAVPSDVKPGPAILTIKSGDGAITTGRLMVAQVMPGLYTAAQNGQGAAAAVAVIAHADGSRSSQTTFNCSGGVCAPEPIRASSTDSLYIELYGTGIRYVSSLSEVSATVDGQNVPVQYAGPSGYTGEDQVNIQIPQSLFHAGMVGVSLTVGGQIANIVTISFQ